VKLSIGHDVFLSPEFHAHHVIPRKLISNLKIYRNRPRFDFRPPLNNTITTTTSLSNSRSTRRIQYRRIISRSSHSPYALRQHSRPDALFIFVIAQHTRSCAGTATCRDNICAWAGYKEDHTAIWIALFFSLSCCSATYNHHSLFVEPFQ